MPFTEGWPASQFFSYLKMLIVFYDLAKIHFFLQIHMEIEKNNSAQTARRSRLNHRTIWGELPDGLSEGWSYM
jgi:hypothetical protein